eukprot:6074234-Heterocapsa_arctica.AAC.1
MTRLRRPQVDDVFYRKYGYFEDLHEGVRRELLHLEVSPTVTRSGTTTWSSTRMRGQRAV